MAEFALTTVTFVTWMAEQLFSGGQENKSLV